jgi:hypothetical protein
MDFVGPIPNISYYGADAMSDAERNEFLEWYETQKTEIFNNRRVLEEYCQGDVTVLRQAYQVFRSVFILIGRVKHFLESMTIATAFNRVLRRVS